MQSLALHRAAGWKAAPVAVALLLAGCGGAETGEQDNGAVPTVNAAAEAPEPAAPNPAPVPKAAPAASAAVLTPEGFGPLKIGMSRAEIVEAYGEDADPQAVGGPDPEQCDQFRPARAPKGLLVMVEDGRLTRISLGRDAAIATDRGLKLGDPAAKVRAAYGSGLVVMPHTYQDPPAEYLTAWTIGRPAKDVTDPNARGIRYEINQDGKVGMIHAGGQSIQYVEGCL